MTKDKYIFGKKTSRKQIVNYCYDYKGHKIVYRFSLPVKEGANKSYYTGLVDKQVAELAKSGKLEKHAKSYIRKMKWLVDRKGITIGVAATVVVVVAVSTAVLITYFNYFHSDNVIFESETLTIDKTSVTLHRDADFAFGVNDFYANYGYYLPDEVDQVAVNGVTLTSDQYSYSNGHLKIAAEYMTGTVYIAAEANYVHFENDTWENIIAYANKGLDDLFIRYGRHSIVGLEHDFEFDGKTIKTRVIGEGHDRLVDENGDPTEKAASVTFQILVDGDYKYNANAVVGDYADSDLKKTCDTLVEKLPTDIKNEVKLVNKYTAGASNYSNEKVFPLSLREINGANPYIDESTYYGLYSEEESPYEYYLEQDETKLNKIRSIDKQYWLRSIADGGAVAVDADGKTEQESAFNVRPQSEENALVVAFAIGETESFITDNWANVTTLANNGLETLKAHYGMESFIGLEREIEMNNGDIRKVRVVGENHDTLADSEDHVAALTFEACYSYESSTYINNPTIIASYANSALKNNLDNYYDINLPMAVKRGIPLVKKINTGIKKVGEDEAVSVIEESDNHLFVLSLRELGDMWFSLAEPFNLEEKAYDYYRMPINSLEEINKIDHLRIKGANDYWTRSSSSLKTDSIVTVTGQTGATMQPTAQGYVLNVTKMVDEGYPSTPHSANYAFAFGFGVSNRPVTFETDSWDNVCYYALQGLDVLKEHYDLRTFIGATKEITLCEDTDHPVTYKVRVIGEEQDTDVNGNKAPLTFEFTTNIAEVITTSERGGIRYLNDFGTPNWSTSDLRTVCNDEVLPLLPFALQNSIRSVTKNTVVYNSEDDKGIETTVDKIFPLSRNEIDDHYGEHSEPEADANLLKKENKTYHYYIDAPEILRIKPNCPSNNTYWLRSPSLQQSPSIDYRVAYSVDADGNVGNTSGRVTTWLGLAPAFAI